MTKNIDHICQKSIFESAICSFVPQILHSRCVCVRLRTEQTQADREIQGGSNDNEEKTIHNRASAVHGAHNGTGGVSHSEVAWAETGGSGTLRPVEKLWIGGKELSTTEGLCYHNASDKQAAVVNNVDEGANAILDPKNGI